MDAACGFRGSSDEAFAFECEQHLMNRWWADAEVALQIRFGGRPSEDACIGVDKGQVLALFSGEAGSRGRSIHVVD